MIKFLAACGIAAVCVSAVVSASAAQIESVTETEGGWEVAVGDCTSDIIAAVYYNDGVLAGFDAFETDSGSCTIELTDEDAGYERVRLFYMNGEFEDVDFTAQSTEEPAETAVPTETPEPEATATAEPENTSFPDIYEREVDAQKAFAVVESIDYSSDSSGSDYYSLNALYQGGERTFEIPTEVGIVYASDAWSNLAGTSLDNLRRGDVIQLSFKVDRTVGGVALITRAEEDNPIESSYDYGTAFSRMFTTNGAVSGQSDWIIYNESSSLKYQYAYGLIGKKTGNVVRLYDQSGECTSEISLESNTIVYTCDMSSKRAVAVGSIGDVTATVIPKTYFDEDENITQFDPDTIYNYALIRTVDKTATDVVVFTNYNY